MSLPLTSHPFDDYALEDFVRYLATWPPDVPNEDRVMQALLLLCQEWSRNH